MALPWTIVFFVLSYLAIQFFYKPEKTDTLPTGYAAEQLAKMGPMSLHEKITLVVLLVSLLCWMTEKIHGIPAAIVALLAVIILLWAKVFDRPDFRAKMPWDVIVFVGTIIGIAAVFPTLKIDKWMAASLAPYVGPLISSPYVFIAGCTILLYIIRFFFISQTGTIVIFTVMFLPLSAQAGISPWIAGMITLTATMTWNVFYQNANYIISYSATGGDLVDKGMMVKLSYAYMVINLIGFMISIPFWQLMGLIK